MADGYTAKRQAITREAKLATVKQQIERGELVVRQATDAERASWPPRGPGRSNTNGSASRAAGGPHATHARDRNLSDELTAEPRGFDRATDDAGDRDE